MSRMVVDVTGWRLGRLGPSDGARLIEYAICADANDSKISYGPTTYAYPAPVGGMVNGVGAAMHDGKPSATKSGLTRRQIKTGHSFSTPNKTRRIPFREDIPNGKMRERLDGDDAFVLEPTNYDEPKDVREIFRGKMDKKCKNDMMGGRTKHRVVIPR